MTMISFRVGDEEAAAAQQVAERLGVSLSELLRQALHRHIVKVLAEEDIAAWAGAPLTSAERSLGEVADWGPAEDWSDWSDATR